MTNPETILIASLLPLSYLIVYVLYLVYKTIFKISEKKKPLHATLYDCFLQKKYRVSTVFYENFEAQVPENGLIKLLNIENNEELLLRHEDLSNEKVLKLIKTITKLCHYPKLEKIENRILKFLTEFKLSEEKPDQKYEILETIHGDQTKKLSTIVARNKKTKKIYAFAKGNSKSILEKTSKILINNQKVEISPEIKKKILERLKKLEEKGEKIITYAYRQLPKKKLEKYSSEFTEKDLVLVSILGLDLPTLENSNNLYKDIRNQNLKLVLSSLEKEKIVLATAKKIGIENFEIITGEKIEKLKKSKLIEKLNNPTKNLLICELNEKQIQALDSIMPAKYNQKEIKKQLKRIQILKKFKLNLPKILTHSIISKISQLSILLASLITNGPLPLTLSMILALELLINLPLQINIVFGTEKKSKQHFITTLNLFSASILAILSYIFILQKTQWQANMAPISSLTNENLSLIFITLTTIQTLSILLFKEIKLNTKILGIIITSLIIFFLIQKQKITPPSQTEMIILFLILICSYLINDIFHISKQIWQKLKYQKLHT